MAFMASSPSAEQAGTKTRFHRAAITDRDGCEVGVEFRQLAYVVAVAEELSFGRAAERLHIVQPAVSQQVRRLERELGVQLFDRSSRHVRLTAAGERLLPEARAILAAADRVRQVAAGIAAGTGGVLRVGTSQGLGERLDHVLEQLGRAAPGLQVRLVSAPAAERIARVRAGVLDAAFVRAVTTAPGVELLPMWQDPLTVALPAAHALAAQPVIQLPQLRTIPLRLAPRHDNPPFHDLIVGACADAGFQPVPGPPFTTLQDTLAEIATGPPAWTVLYTAATDLIPPRRVAFRPLAGLATQTCLAVPPGPPGPALRRLLDACASASAITPGKP
jgi:DNA-binding transcriptional LysR family regulator